MIKKSIKKMLLYTQLFNKMSCQISLVFKKLNGGLVANIRNKESTSLFIRQLCIIISSGCRTTLY